MSTSSLFTCENLAVGYHGRPVLSGLNLDLKQGRFTGLAGQNGSGKTTLLKTLAGILPPVAGRLRCHPPGGGRVAIGYVPQHETLDPMFLLSAFEIALMGGCGRVGPGRSMGAEERDRARRCLEQAGAGELASRQFSELSGGQKQRVLIARALVTQPDLLLLDEPTSGLDASAARNIMELLQRLNREQSLTLLMVHHDLPTLRGHVEEVIWLHDGRSTVGPAETMLTRERIEEMLQLA